MQSLDLGDVFVTFPTFGRCVCHIPDGLGDVHDFSVYGTCEIDVFEVLMVILTHFVRKVAAISS